MNNIPYGKQSLNQDDIKAVVRVLRSDWLTQGPNVKVFEEELCRSVKAPYACALANGTAALHLSMLALGVGPGDEVITSPITFSASANCAIYVGARPTFVDIEDATYHMDLDKLRDYLKSPSRRKNVKAIIPVHFMGTVSDVAAIQAIAQRYGIKVIDDAAHALGAQYRDEDEWVKIGSCRHSDMTIFSFHPIKQITTGEGGALLTNNKEIYEKVLKLRHHGIVRDPSHNGWFYDVEEVGFNYRITDIQCALGSSQLKKLAGFIKRRAQLVKEYNRAFAGIDGIRTPFERPGTKSSYHLYVIRIKAGTRDGLYQYLKSKGILTQVNYIPVHLLSAYKKLGYRTGDYPVAEKYYEECLSLPLFPELTGAQQQKVIREVKRYFHG